MYPVEMTGIHLLPSGLYRRCRSFNGSTFRARLHSGLADYTAGWEFHPTLKISGANIMIVCHFWYFIGYFQGCFPTCCPFRVRIGHSPADSTPLPPDFKNGESSVLGIV